MSSILLEFVTKAHAYLSHCNVAHWLIHLQANIFGIRTYVLRCRHHIPLQYLLLVVLSLWSCWTICRISLRLERVVRTIKWRSEAVYYSLWWFFDRFLNMKISCVLGLPARCPPPVPGVKFCTLRREEYSSIGLYNSFLILHPTSQCLRDFEKTLDKSSSVWILGCHLVAPSHLYGRNGKSYLLIQCTILTHEMKWCERPNVAPSTFYYRSYFFS